MKIIRNYVLMAAFATFGLAIAGCSSNKKPSGQGDVQYANNEQLTNDEQSESNAPTTFTSKKDVLDYVLDCWWTCDKFKILISENAGFKYQDKKMDSPSVDDLNYIEVRRFEGKEAIIEYSYNNIAAGRQVLRSEVSLSNGTITFGTNILHKEGEVKNLNEEEVDTLSADD